MIAKATLATLTAVFALGLAEAATVSYSGSVSDVTIYNPYGKTEIIFPKFDASIAGPNGDQMEATLNSVTLVLSGTQYAELFLANPQGEGGTWFVYMVNGAIIFGDGPLSTDMNVSQTVQYGEQVQIPDHPSETTLFPAMVVAPGVSEETFTSGLAGFMGAGTVSQHAYFSGGWGAMGMSASDTLSTPVYTGSADWSVIYDYTPVPEPSVAVLLLVGGVGLVWRRRRAGARPGERGASR